MLDHAIQYANDKMRRTSVGQDIDSLARQVTTTSHEPAQPATDAPTGGATIDRELPQGSRPGVDATTSDASTLIPGIPPATLDTAVVLDTRDNEGETLSTAVPAVADDVPPAGAPDYRTLSR